MPSAEGTEYCQLLISWGSERVGDTYLQCAWWSKVGFEASLDIGEVRLHDIADLRTKLVDLLHRLDIPQMINTRYSIDSKCHQRNVSHLRPNKVLLAELMATTSELVSTDDGQYAQHIA